MSASYDPLASPIDGVTLKFIELTNGIRLRVAFAGEEKGTPLLFMHGWPESWFSWRHQLQYFGKNGYRVMAPDMRGYGYSSCPPNVDDYDVHCIASDMMCLLQSQGLSKSYLIGHDWGASLCWSLGHLHPEVFPVLAALSVPTGMRYSSATNPFEGMKKLFKVGTDEEMFFYICYHNERFPGTQNGPAEASYDANPKESIRTFWSDETIERDTNGIITSPFRKDGGMLARTGRPKRLPKWLSEADLEYVTKQFKHSGFRGGVNYYRNIGRNFMLTPHLTGKTIDQPSFFLT